MELATAFHHSAQRVEAPREGMEGEKYYAPRRQKPPLLGKGPGVPLDPELQVAAATVGCVAAPVPLLVVPSMAGGDSVDGTTTKWLLKVALRKS